ncbi:Maleylpyruvate isomerase [Methylorubrum aminovorans]|uniref:Maleylpyruvate isomerase n=1 Tax=Methylorubrum aminovorans TaxID=269069 RepID=A0ABQ4UGC9_9HYPH|nr:glutathione S-transferase [Methylorubrum aminovorans]GJE65862.1 Maleylpyruvate isomerase [Methylorubrum aminovorans]GMA75782.1 glutathione S-transferase [Methylorubrum aminovorans]
MKLYSLTLSGHAHRARLFLSLLGLPFETVEVDFAGGQNRSPDFLAINSFGQVPVLDDAGVIVPDSNAILVYLAKKLGRGDWLPEDAEGAARVQRWLSVAAGPIANGPCAARLVTLFGARFDAAEVIARAHQILALIDAELSARDWLAAERPTIADVALYSYIAAAPEGNVDLAAYGHVRAWLARIEALPGYVALPTSPVGLNATGGSA